MSKLNDYLEYQVQAEYNFTGVKEAMENGESIEEKLKNGFKAWLEGPEEKKKEYKEIMEYAKQKDDTRELDKFCKQNPGECKYTHKVILNSKMAENLTYLFIRQLYMVEGPDFQEQAINTHNRITKGEELSDKNYENVCGWFIKNYNNIEKREVVIKAMRIAKSQAMTQWKKSTFLGRTKWEKLPNPVKMFQCTDPSQEGVDQENLEKKKNPKGLCRGGRKKSRRKKRRRKSTKKKHRKSTKKKRKRKRKRTKKKRRRRRR